MTRRRIVTVPTTNFHTLKGVIHRSMKISTYLARSWILRPVNTNTLLTSVITPIYEFIFIMVYVHVDACDFQTYSWWLYCCELDYVLIKRSSAEIARRSRLSFYLESYLTRLRKRNNGKIFRRKSRLFWLILWNGSSFNSWHVRRIFLREFIVLVKYTSGVRYGIFCVMTIENLTVFFFSFLQYLGCVEVFESRGMQVCEEALKVLKVSINYRLGARKCSYLRSRQNVGNLHVFVYFIFCLRIAFDVYWRMSHFSRIE